MVNSDKYIKAMVSDSVAFLDMHEKLRLSIPFYKCFQGEGEFYEKNVDELETLGYEDKYRNTYQENK